MEANQVARIVESLDGAIAVLRDAEGRRNAADIRVQSILAAARDTLESRDQPSNGPRRKRETASLWLRPPDSV